MSSEYTRYNGASQARDLIIGLVNDRPTIEQDAFFRIRSTNRPVDCHGIELATSQLGLVDVSRLEYNSTLTLGFNFQHSGLGILKDFEQVFVNAYPNYQRFFQLAANDQYGNIAKFLLGDYTKVSIWIMGNHLLAKGDDTNLTKFPISQVARELITPWAMLSAYALVLTERIMFDFNLKPES